MKKSLLLSLLFSKLKNKFSQNDPISFAPLGFPCRRNCETLSKASVLLRHPPLGQPSPLALMAPWQNISLRPDDAEAFPTLQEEEEPIPTNDWWLVGRVHTNQSIDNGAFKSMVTNPWKTKNGFEVRDIATNLFTFRFFAERKTEKAS